MMGALTDFTAITSLHLGLLYLSTSCLTFVCWPASLGGRTCYRFYGYRAPSHSTTSLPPLFVASMRHSLSFLPCPFPPHYIHSDLTF